MAIVSAEIAHGGTGGNISRTGERRYLVTYNVKTNSYQDGVIAIVEHFRTTGGLPFYGDPYNFFGEQDLNSFCERITPRKKDRSQTEWEVLVEFKERDQRQDEAGNPTGNPIEHMRLFQFFFNPRLVPVETAGWGGFVRKSNTGGRVINTTTKGYYAGKGVGAIVQPVNAAGDVLDLFTDQSDLVFACQVNLPSYNADQAQDFIDRVNSADIQLDLSATIYQCHLKIYKWCAKITSYGATFRAENWTDNLGDSKTTYYWEHTFEFAVRTGMTFTDADPRGWRDWLPNSGYNRSARVGDPDGKGGTIGVTSPPGRSVVARILDADDLPVSEPVGMDPEGQPIAESADAWNIEFSHLEVRDFTTIPGIGFTAWTP